MAYDGNYLANNPAAQLAYRQRLIRITRAAINSKSLTPIAQAERVSFERIRQIVFDTCALATRFPKRSMSSPGVKYWRLKFMRGEHRKFWLTRLTALERLWQLPRDRVKKGDRGRRAPRARSSDTSE